jgi:AraC family transcriptional regulator, exoenzyme S synthesis regulatory protein ExsA
MLNLYDLKIAHPEVFKQIAIKDNLIVYYRCPQSEQLVKLYNNYEELLFTLSGKKIIHLGNKNWTLTEEDSLLIRKTAYVQEMFENVDWEVLAFHFNADFVKNVIKEFNNHFSIPDIPVVPRDMVLRIHVNANIRATFYAMIPLFSKDIMYSENLIERRVTELLINILAEPKNIDILAYFNHVYSQEKIPIWHVMESNFMFNLPISEFAKLCQRSMSTFKSDFYNYYQTSPGRWLLEKRVTHAKQLLETTGKNINEIAFQSGFENISHFNRVFKERFGRTPSHYRKKNYSHTTSKHTLLTSQKSH